MIRWIKNLLRTRPIFLRCWSEKGNMQLFVKYNGLLLFLGECSIYYSEKRFSKAIKYFLEATGFSYRHEEPKYFHSNSESEYIYRIMR